MSTAPPSPAKEVFKDSFNQGARFTSTASRSALAGSLKPTVMHFGYAIDTSDGISDMQALKMSSDLTRHGVSAGWQALETTAQATVHGVHGSLYTLEHAPEIARAGIQTVTNAPGMIKQGVTDSFVAMKDSAAAMKNSAMAMKENTIATVKATPGRVVDGFRSGVNTVKSGVNTVRAAPGKAANATKSGFQKTSKFIRDSPDKSRVAVKKAGKSVAKTARNTVNTVRTSAMRAGQFVRSNGGIMKTGMKLGKAGAKAAGRASVSALNRFIHKLGESIKKLVLRAVGALVGFVSKILVVVLVVFLALLLFFQSFLPGWLYSIFFEEEKKHSLTVEPLDDYPWRAVVLGSNNDCAGENCRPNILTSMYTTDQINPATRYAYGNCTDFVFWRVNRDKILRSGTPEEKQAIKNLRYPVDTSWWPYTWGTLTPNGGHGYQWGEPGNMPGWETVSDVAHVIPGDVVSIKPGVDGNSAEFGHVGYVNAVDQNTRTVSVENYGNGKYYVTEYTFDKLAGNIADGTYVFRHDPENTISASGLVTGDIDADTATPEGAKQYAAARLADYGWDSPEEYQCLVQLWEHESSWRYDAVNSSSGAAGIPQLLPSAHNMPEGYMTNGKSQIEWGLQYIQGRGDYGSPCAAWNLWQSRSPHWY